MKKSIFLLLLTAFVLTNCQPKHKHAVVHVYKTQEGEAADLLADVFYYVIDNGTEFYYTKSSSPITNYQSVSWTRSATIKQELQEERAEELQEQEVPLEDLTQEIQTEVDTNPGDFEASSEDASGGDSGSDGGGDSGGDGGGDGGGGGE